MKTALVVNVWTVHLLVLPGWQKLRQRPELLDRVLMSWEGEEKRENSEVFVNPYCTRRIVLHVLQVFVLMTYNLLHKESVERV